MFPWILSFTLCHVRQSKVRLLSVARAKGDDVQVIKRTAEALRSRRTDQDEAWSDVGPGAIVLRQATDGWDMQFPEPLLKGYWLG